MPNQEEQDMLFLRQAIELAKKNVSNQKGGPFAAIIVKNNKIIARGTNLVTANNDPTAHAEIIAIRNACKKLNTFYLDDCVIYASCEPCPMCLGAIYWAHLQRLVFAANKKHAADAGFDDDFIYKEIALDYSDRKIRTSNICCEACEEPFQLWMQNETKINY
ncbi:MAG: nucleoside deaminase [Bacteroidales bacterium]|nr:nucleoside deaminase [Bacteroidales bacterium]